MKMHHILFRGVVALALALAIIIGEIRTINLVSAANSRVAKPDKIQNLADLAARTSSVLGEDLDVNDINQPSADPGVASQPFSKFSGINAPVWLNQEDGKPVQIYDDLVIYGLTDVKNEITNTGGPVTIYDDLYVQGSGQAAEPGNVYINGLDAKIVGNPNLTIGSNLQVDGDMQVLGNVTAPNLEVTNVSAKAIGRYYRVDKSVVKGKSTTVSATASCASNDVLVSCGGYIKSGAAADSILTTLIKNRTPVDADCTATGNVQTNGAAVVAQAVCLDSNMNMATEAPPSGKDVTVTKLN